VQKQVELWKDWRKWAVAQAPDQRLPDIWKTRRYPMESKELLIALLYVGFQLQTKGDKNEDQGAFIAGYRDFKKEFDKAADEKWQKR
jgi:hypothetical protein